jgi:GTP diphosphokinase / guanosine-3',5'-bis(diphosphate) 3'-diphosphatase
VYNNIMKAMLWAAELHEGQLRKGRINEPYIMHPLRVAELVSRHPATSEKMVIAALLHDAVEDCGTTIEAVRERFGPSVSLIVSELTDDKTLPKHIRKRMQVYRAGRTSIEARIIKLADKIDNVRDLVRDPPVGWNDDRIAEYVVFANDVVKELGPVDLTLEQEFKDAVAEAKASIA